MLTMSSPSQAMPGAVDAGNVYEPTSSEIVQALTPPPPPPPQPAFPWGLVLVAGGVGLWLYTRKKGKVVA